MFFSIKITSLPDGTVKLEIEHVKPTDSGAYKLVLSNPNGESIAICAVAVKRKFFLFFYGFNKIITKPEIINRKTEKF